MNFLFEKIKILIFGKNSVVEMIRKNLVIDSRNIKYEFYDTFSDIEKLDCKYDIIFIDINSEEDEEILSYLSRREYKNIIIGIDIEKRDTVSKYRYMGIKDLIYKPYNMDEFNLKMNNFICMMKSKHEAKERTLQFNTLLNNVPYMAWFKNTNSEYMLVNDEFKEHCGKDIDIINGRDDQFVWDGQIGENCRKYDMQVMLERKQIVFDEVIPGRKGYKEFNIYKAPFIDDNNIVKGTIGIARDITDLKNKDAKFKMLIENIPFTIYMKDLRGTILSSNRNFLTSFNLTEEDYKNLREEDLFGDTFKDIIELEDKKIISEKTSINFVRVLEQNGEKKIVEIYKAPVIEISREVQGIVCVMRDVTDIKAQEEKIKEMAYTDSLTNLANRRGLYNYIENEFSKENFKITVMFIDLDNFKLINDSFGHFYGDDALRTFCKRLSEICEDGFISRMGGDEFVVVWKNICDEELLTEKAEEIIQIFTDSKSDGKLRKISVSIGIVSGSTENESIDTLLMKGDMALYYAKEKGKSQYVFYNSQLDEKRCLNQEIENDLRMAIERKELYLNYQPQYDCSGKLKGFEALLRWRNPKYKNLPIIEVIKIMEKTNLIDEIGRFVIKTAFAFSKKLNRNREKKIIVCVNISSIQIMKSNFVRKIKKYLKELDVDPKGVGIEITETILLENIDENIKKLHELKELGMAISLDDFGTGYSSFNYLVRLPLSSIKIDKSFIRGINIVDEYRKLIEFTLNAGHALKLKVVGEGVETETEFKILKKMGIDYIQGYLFSKPVSEEEAEKIAFKVDIAD